MQRKTFCPIATALVIGLAAGYLLWGRQQPEPTKVSGGEVAAASKGESPPDPAPRIPARDRPAGTASRPTRATADHGVPTGGGAGQNPPPPPASPPAPAPCPPPRTEHRAQPTRREPRCDACR